MLSESSEGWVLYDDAGRVVLLRSDHNTVLLDAAKVMRDNCVPYTASWTAVPDTELQTLRFLPRLGASCYT